MEEKKINFFQWFISVLKWDRENYRAPEEEKERIFRKIVEEDKKRKKD